MNNANPTGTDTGNTTSMAKVPAPKDTRTPYNAMDMSNAECERPASRALRDI